MPILLNLTQLWVFFTTIVFLCKFFIRNYNYQYCGPWNYSHIVTVVLITYYIVRSVETQRQLSNIGPRNITRTEGEVNVYIPCPFPGSFSPIWIISGMHYEAFNLPENMYSVSFGLLIKYVTKEMDGKTFQCILQADVENGFYSSSIGILTVEELQPRN